MMMMVTIQILKYVNNETIDTLFILRRWRLLLIHIPFSQTAFFFHLSHSLSLSLLFYLGRMLITLISLPAIIIHSYNKNNLHACILQTLFFKLEMKKHHLIYKRYCWGLLIKHDIVDHPELVILRKSKDGVKYPLFAIC